MARSGLRLASWAACRSVPPLVKGTKFVPFSGLPVRRVSRLVSAVACSLAASRRLEISHTQTGSTRLRVAPVGYKGPRQGTGVLSYREVARAVINEADDSRLLKDVMGQHGQPLDAPRDERGRYMSRGDNVTLGRQRGNSRADPGKPEITRDRRRTSLSYLRNNRSHPLCSTYDPCQVSTVRPAR
jgi:hypothetical protein